MITNVCFFPSGAGVSPPLSPAPPHMSPSPTLPTMLGNSLGGGPPLLPPSATPTIPSPPTSHPQSSHPQSPSRPHTPTPTTSSSSLATLHHALHGLHSLHSLQSLQTQMAALAGLQGRSMIHFKLISFSQLLLKFVHEFNGTGTCGANCERCEMNLLLFTDATALVADSEKKLCRLSREFGRGCKRRKSRVMSTSVIRCSWYVNV